MGMLDCSFGGYVNIYDCLEVPPSSHTDIRISGYPHFDCGQHRICHHLWDTSPVFILLLLPVAIGAHFTLQLLFVKEIGELVKSNNAIYSAAGYIGLPALSGCLFLIGRVFLVVCAGACNPDLDK